MPTPTLKSELNGIFRGIGYILASWSVSYLWSCRVGAEDLMGWLFGGINATIIILLSRKSMIEKSNKSSEINTE
jgi:hypothetical protein